MLLVAGSNFTMSTRAEFALSGSKDLGFCPGVDDHVTGRHLDGGGMGREGSG